MKRAQKATIVVRVLLLNHGLLSLGPAIVSALDSSLDPYFFLALRALRAFCLLIFAAFWAPLLISPLYNASSFSFSNLRAIPRLSCSDRLCWHCTTTVYFFYLFFIRVVVLTCTRIPVGICLRSTQLTRLFTAWPPGPEPLTNFSTRSSSLSTILMRSFVSSDT